LNAPTRVRKPCTDTTSSQSSVRPTKVRNFAREMMKKHTRG